MDKLKIVKVMVFFMTFCLVFLLCIAINKVMLNKRQQTFDIKIENIVNYDKDNFYVAGDYAFITSSEKIYVINVNQGILRGTISLGKE